MNKIIIIGSPGAGKSTLARKLSEKLNIPIHHLDNLYWQAGWQAVDERTFQQCQEKILSAERWIVDGNYSTTLNMRLAACDTVIFLDYPTWRCLAGVTKRRLKYRKKTRPDMAEGCPEKLDWAFFLFVLRFRRDKLPKTEAALKKCGTDKKIYRLKSPKQMKQLLTNVL
ncbi:DNA topology modulation protein [Amphibacillus jilinensis]|uniref:DNA topology modulation protein n=1 Tax=Amphibacillus jilinensis TaxID=1216008 RepID=UPI00030EAEB6|nr:DNA topology modulation protein [Amphibacillus jilinensis]